MKAGRQQRVESGHRSDAAEPFQFWTSQELKEHGSSESDYISTNTYVEKHWTYA